MRDHEDNEMTLKDRLFAALLDHSGHMLLDGELDALMEVVRSAEESAARRCAEIIESYCGKDHSPHEACWRYVYAHEGGEKIRSEFGLGEEGDRG